MSTPLGPSHHTGSNEDDHTEDDSFTDGFEVVSLPFSARTSSDSKNKNTASDDKERLLNTVVEVMGLIVWEEAIDVIVTDDVYLKHVCFVMCLSNNLVVMWWYFIFRPGAVSSQQ